MIQEVEKNIRANLLLLIDSPLPKKRNVARLSIVAWQPGNSNALHSLRRPARRGRMRGMDGNDWNRTRIRYPWFYRFKARVLYSASVIFVCLSIAAACIDFPHAVPLLFAAALAGVAVNCYFHARCAASSAVELEAEEPGHTDSAENQDLDRP